MAVYRYGLKTNCLNEQWYSIEKRILFVWIEVFEFRSHSKMMSVVDQLKTNNVIFEV